MIKLLTCWVPAAIHWIVVLLPAAFVWVLHCQPYPVILSLFFETSEDGTLEQYLVNLLPAVYCVCAFVHFYWTCLYSPPRSPPVTLRNTPALPTIKKKVAVIGCGPIGIVTTKELLQEGHQVKCFESSPRIGGEFANGFWPGGRLTSSPYVTAFSDYAPPPRPKGENQYKHWTKEEFCEYLEGYARHFGVSNPGVLHVNTRVIDVTTKSPRKFSWLNRQQRQASQRGLPKDRVLYYVQVEETVTNSEGSVSTATRVEGPFEHVAVCSGVNATPTLFSIPGMESFDGEIIHTADFRRANSKGTGESATPDDAFGIFSDKRVLTIGMGESMADILYLMTHIDKPPAYTAASVRGGVFVIPRVNPLNGQNNDHDSTRIRYSMPKMIHNWTIVLCTYLSNVCATMPSEEREIRCDLLFKLKRFLPAYTRSCKSDDFIKSVTEGLVELRTGIDRINERTVHFKDGSKMENVDAILFGSGYAGTTYPFLGGGIIERGAKINPSFSPSERLFRMIDPNLGDTLVFIGPGARPTLGSNPTTCEMQARLFALIVSGKRQLPPEDVMRKRIRQDYIDAKRDLSPTNDKWKSIVFWIPFMDSLAAEIDCLPKRRWMFTRPKLYWSLLFAPMTAFHYRLTGPNAQPEYAEKVIKKLPIGTRKKDLLFFLSIHGIISLVMWPLTALRLLVFEPIISMLKMLVQKHSSFYDDDELRYKDIAEMEGERRPPLCQDPNVELALKEDSEGSLRSYQQIYGSMFRYLTSARVSTVVVLDKMLADMVLKSRNMGFYQASFQSKIRFGLQKLVKQPRDALVLSRFFRKFLMGSSTVKVFEAKINDSLERRLANMMNKLKQGSSMTMTLAEFVAQTVFAVNTDVIFGPDVYSAEFYEDYQSFNESMGSRAAPTHKRIEAQIQEEEKLNDAKARLLAKIRKARTGNSGAAPIITEIKSSLNPDDNEADLVGLLILWGSNVNMLPTNVWVLATLLQKQEVLTALHKERSSLDDPSSLDQKHRPLLSAAICEVLRLRSRPNMYRVVSEDTTIELGSEYKGNMKTGKVEFQAGDWVWLFPRLTLHYDPKTHPEPNEFKPFERFGGGCPFKAGNNGDSGASIPCPFRNGNPGLRVFGGGTAPCPGKDYAAILLKAMTDVILLSGKIKLELIEKDALLPGAVTATVSSTPAPSEDILVYVSEGAVASTTALRGAGGKTPGGDGGTGRAIHGGDGMRRGAAAPQRRKRDKLKEPLTMLGLRSGLGSKPEPVPEESTTAEASAAGVPAPPGGDAMGRNLLQRHRKRDKFKEQLERLW